MQQNSQNLTIILIIHLTKKLKTKVRYRHLNDMQFLISSLLFI